MICLYSGFYNHVPIDFYNFSANVEVEINKVNLTDITGIDGRIVGLIQGLLVHELSMFKDIVLFMLNYMIFFMCFYVYLIHCIELSRLLGPFLFCIVFGLWKLLFLCFHS